MGQGYSLTTLSAGSAGIDVPELSDLTYEKSLGDARFMKSVRARHRHGLVVAKVVMKPYASMKFGSYIKQITHERDVLHDIPNVLAYHRAFETSSNGYLIRQYINNSIYDRMSTRPFLEDIEKRWLAFQLLCAVRDCHSRNVYHGDIKTENTLVTSWNWLYLSDFSSSFKPTYLPEDNPADFSFYFDISGRRTCYLAPERFLTHGESPEGRGSITWAMDIFSVGCVIAELFLEGPIFNLSQLFKYRQGAYDPEMIHLSRIEDTDVRELVSHMIQLEPESRYSADEYLNFWRRKAFPEYFYSFLHQYMLHITSPTFVQTQNVSDEDNSGESDERIDQVYFDFDKISYFLGYDSVPSIEPSQTFTKRSPEQVFPLHLDVPNQSQLASAKVAPTTDDGTLLFLNVVTSALRSTARSTARIRACELLLVFAERLTDEAKLDRVLPFVVSLLNDPADIIKVAALRTLTQLVALVTTTSPVNAYLFPEYIIPRLEAFIPLSTRKTSSLVRACYAYCIALLAETAARFLDTVQALKAEGFMASIAAEAENGAFSDAHQNLYDIARADLVKFFETQTKALLTDPSSDVRRAFLGSVSSLCVFFGSAKANDVVLSHLNTYLNDRDWKLKCAFFDTIVGVAVYVGSTSLEEFILPLMVQALTDPEESVVEKVLRSLSTMAQLGLFQRSRIWELVDLVARFTMHPNIWIKESAAHFLSSSTRFLTAADCECIMKPLLQPYLHCIPQSLNETDLLDSLKKPLPRSVLDMAVTWATRVDKGIFWKPIQARLTTNVIEDRVQVVPSLDLRHNALTKAPKNEEDHQWLSRLRNAGMTAGDEVKLLALREYIWRMAQRKMREASEPVSSRFNEVVSITSLGVDLETVFFDRRQQFFDDVLRPNNSHNEDNNQPQTIADALLDASTTIDSSPPEQAPTHPEKAIRSSRGTLKTTSPKISSPLSSSPVTHTDTQEACGQDRDKERATKETFQQSREGSATPPRPADGVERLRHSNAIPRKGSAIDLMQQRASSSKATAEISTSSTNAVGKNDGLYTRHVTKAIHASTTHHDQRLNPKQAQYEGAHSYSGRDPNVLRLLDNLYLENYPVDAFDFGPTVTPIERRQIEKTSVETSGRRWQPNKRLVATFGEHDGPVSRVAVSPDHLFFITASDDGSVRVWDSARLEQNLTHRSKQVHRHAPGVKVTSICFIENTHCFVSAGSDGTVHVVKVDCTESSQGYTKYGKLRLLRQWRLPNPSSQAVWIEHVKFESQSVLILATSDSQIISLDLKNMSVVYTLESPIHHGRPTCFCLDHHKHWLLLGTTHGVLSLWDLRFRLRLRSWGFHGAAPITRLALHPSPPEKERENNEVGPRMKQKLVCVTGGTGASEATIWNLEKASCVGVYRTALDVMTSPPPTVPRQDYKVDSSRRYNLVNMDDSDSSKMLKHFASRPPDDLNSVYSDWSIKGLAVGKLSTGMNEKARNPYMITAGPRPAVHFWDLHRIENSRVVNGLNSDMEDGTDEIGTKFIRADSLSMIPVYEEKLQMPLSGTSGPITSGNQAESSASIATATREQNASNAKSSDQVPTPPTKTTAINEKQQKLLKSHLDSVLDVAILEYPFRMIVSVDRSGIVLVSA